MKKVRVIRRRLPQQKELRVEVKRRHDRYRELVEQSHEGIWRFELDEPIDTRLPVEKQMQLMMETAYLAECNAAMAGMYGYSDQSELLGLRLNQLFLPEKEENQLYLKSFIQNQYKLADVESVEADKDGRILHFRNNLLGIVKDHRLLCAWGMQKDITREVENRRILQRSEERLRMASEAGGVGIWEWNVKSHELYWSDRAKQIFGYPPTHRVTLNDYLQVVHPDDRDHTSHLINNALDASKGTHFLNEHRILVNGSIGWVIGHGETLFDEHGQAIRVTGTLIDVTEHKRAEIQAMQLRDVGSQLATAITLQQLSDVVRDFALQNLKAQAVAVHCRRNPGATLDLILAHGFNPEAVEHLQANVPTSAELVLKHEPHSFCSIPIILNHLLLGVISLQFADRQTFDKDFQEFARAFADQCAQAFERAHLYEMERVARREAESANKAKSRFLANMSHEIRTPLGAIIGFAELLNEEDVSPEDREDCLARILRNGNLLADMINDILDLSKIESEKLEVEHIDFELIPLVQEAIALLQLKAQEKNLRLVLAAAGHLPDVVHSDPTRLRQILINLLGNAIKFTEKGHIEIRMAPMYSSDGVAQVRFTIVDTGMGIPPAQHNRIFEPFMQADSSTTRKFGGTGLGLAVARGLAQALGGDLQLVKSAVGEGSTFAFTIDVGATAADAQPTPQNQGAARKTLAPQELAGLQILVVDDNPDNRTYISSFLTSAGARIETACNGVQAVELATQRDYNIVLMDIQMPELDGFGAMRYLKSQDYAKPVLALTAHAMAGDRENSLNAGFQDHLVKPIDRTSLIQAIKKYTGGMELSGL